MAIAKKPNRNPAAPAATVEDAAEAFIQGGGAAPVAPVSQPVSRPAPVKRAKKEPVLLRFDDTTLAQIDAAAAALGLSRAAWVRMVVAEKLNG